MDIDLFWEYSDPSGSEERFITALENAIGDERLELMTQVARTYSLRGRFEDAHRLLDEVEKELDSAGNRPQIRYELERGRTFNSSQQTVPAQEHFQRAWGIALTAGEEGLAVDAAHMLAIACSGQTESIKWSRKGIELARQSQDPKARALIPAMLNNAAWDLHDRGRYNEALPLFEMALAEWTSTGKIHQTLIARWAVARCLRSLDRFEEALAIQLEVQAAHLENGTLDGYVLEEIAENLWALGRTDEAKPFFEKALNELKKDAWLLQNEAERINQLELRSRQTTGE
jgi:tetratricopeptide (TPR) repeat protein